MENSGLAEVNVGDELILCTGNRYRGDEPVTVSRIGRKFLYVARRGGSEYRSRFLLDSGLEDSQHGARERLYTQEQYDGVKLRTSLFEQLRQAGIDVRYEVRSTVTTQQLGALLAVMAPAGE